MTQLRTLGGLWLEPSLFTQPKPLLLLTYLAVEGSQYRKHLAELFWPTGNRMKSLGVSLTRLRQGAGEVVKADDKKTWTTIPSDARELLESLDKSDWQKANELYTGAFLEGIVLNDWSTELEEWVYTTREYLAERVQYALFNLAEKAAKKQDFKTVAKIAERAYKLRGLPGTELTNLKQLYLLLTAGQSMLAPEVRKEAEEYGLTLQLSSEEARATFKKEAKISSTMPMRGTSFVGRNEELAELATLLNKPNVALLTLLGSAGVGKTRLALQLAHEQQKLSTFKDGVYFVALDALNDASLIPSSLLSYFGLMQQGKTEPFNQLTEFIANKNVLLVLDNFEHLTEGSSLLSQFISPCPNLKLLVTSREKLRLEEEFVFTLEGLPYPQTLSEDAKLSEALQLFRERAQQAQPRFDIERHLTDVIRICQLVEGLPLGIELAANWVRVMSCKDITTELEKGLELLTSDNKNVPQRHRSLKAAFEQSWKLLTEKEQEVLRKLSVFVGGFRREAASEVAGATIPLLASLVDKSLLRVLPNGRYDRHSLLYQFTHEKLTENVNEQLEIEAKHTAFFLHFAENAARHFHSNSRGHWFQRLDEELDNLRVVLNRATLEQNAVSGLNLVTDLPEFWLTRGLQQEIHKYLVIFLNADSIKNSLRHIKGLNLLAHILLQQGEIEKARSYLEEALSRGKSLDDSTVISKTLELLAHLYHYNLADYALAKSFYEQSIALAEQGDNKVRKASSLNLLAILVSEQGDFEGAQAMYEESLRLWRSLGHSSGVAWVLNNKANIFTYHYDFNQAGLLFKESLDLFRELGEKNGIATTLANFGTNEINQHRYENAKPFLEESLELATTLEDKRLMAYVLRSLGETAFFQTDHETAHALYKKSYTLYAQFGYTHGMTETLGLLGQLFHHCQEWDKAEHSYLEGLSLVRSSSDLAALSHLACNLALLYLNVGKYEPANTLLLESLHAAKQISSPGAIVLALEGFAIFATLTGRLESAVLLWGNTDSKRQEINFFRNHIEETHYHTSNKHLRQKLNQFNRVYQRGRNLELEQAIELVLEGSGLSPHQTSTEPVTLEAAKA